MGQGWTGMDGVGRGWTGLDGVGRGWTGLDSRSIDSNVGRSVGWSVCP